MRRVESRFGSVSMPETQFPLQFSPSLFYCLSRDLLPSIRDLKRHCHQPRDSRQFVPRLAPVHHHCTYKESNIEYDSLLKVLHVDDIHSQTRLRQLRGFLVSPRPNSCYYLHLNHAQCQSDNCGYDESHSSPPNSCNI